MSSALPPRSPPPPSRLARTTLSILHPPLLPSPLFLLRLPRQHPLRSTPRRPSPGSAPTLPLPTAPPIRCPQHVHQVFVHQSLVTLHQQLLSEGDEVTFTVGPNPRDPTKTQAENVRRRRCSQTPPRGRRPAQIGRRRRYAQPLQAPPWGPVALGEWRSEGRRPGAPMALLARQHGGWGPSTAELSRLPPPLRPGRSRPPQLRPLHRRPSPRFPLAVVEEARGAAAPWS